MKIAVITAISNNYNRLRDDFKVGKAEYMAFLDKETEENFIYSDVWDVRPMIDLFKDPNRNAKIYKILSHRFTDADYTIWIDGNISMNIEPEKLIKEWLANTDVAVFKHFSRNCIYDEAREVIRIGKDNPSIVLNQVERYRKEGYKEKNGLAECGVLVMRRTKEVNALCEKWWAEICSGSRRDQISFPYVFNGKYKAIDGNVRHHKYFNYEDHII